MTATYLQPADTLPAQSDPVRRESLYRRIQQATAATLGRWLIGQPYYGGPVTALIEARDGSADAELVRRLRTAFVTAGTLPPEDVVVLAPGSLPAEGDGPVAPVSVLAAYRRRELPIRTVDSLTPPVPAGLPVPAKPAPTPSSAPASIGVEELRGAIADLLGLDSDEIGAEDDLVELGLDSIRVMQLVNLWRERGIEVNFADLMQRPVLSEWAGLLATAGSADSSGSSAADPDAPFPLTPVQHAYWIGRRDDQPLGGVGCHFYVELDGTAVDPQRLERAVRALFDRHRMLRAVFEADGRQRVEARTRWPGLVVHDLSAMAAEDAEERLADIRSRLSHRRLEVERGEVFDVQLSLLPEGATRIHVNTDLLVADVASIQILLNDLTRLYAGDELDELDYDFADYLTEQARRRSQAHERGARYWQQRIPQLPGAPALPTAVDPAVVGRPRFARHEHRLSAEEWSALAEHARRHGLTLPMALATAFAEVLGAFSSEPRFLLNLPLFDRESIHPAVPDMVADFSNLILLEVDTATPQSFVERAQQLQQRFRADVRHSAYSGVEVLRDLARAHPATTSFAPVVFTSAIGMGELIAPAVEQTLGSPHYMISQTPQVWLDHQVVELGGGLLLNWDVVSGLFPAGVVESMFAAYVGLLRRLVAGEWSAPVGDVVPAGQRAVRDVVNATAGPVSGRLLHEGFFEVAAREPGRVALVWGESGRLEYGRLAESALRVAGGLVAAGVRAGDAVAVTLPKGVDQVVAVLGVLAAGGVYVPVGVDQPVLRRQRIVSGARAGWVLTDEQGAQWSWPAGVQVLTVAGAGAGQPLPGPVSVSDAQLAYVIFTSGSTGEPKGVQVSHRAAVNTVEDVVGRYGLGGQDRVLAVSALDFDLSVFDVFGLLAVGGALVLVPEQARRDPGVWVELVRRHRVSVWNSVPALLDMLLTAAGPGGVGQALRLVLVSGDWVGLDLPDRVQQAAPGCRFIALGGATEAAIWSNACEVHTPLPAHWRSVPYGTPLRNQRYRVVDTRGRDCPDWVAGELWIGGLGVADGYRGAPELTEQRFLTDPDGTRWYRTGDLGRYWPDGTLEFLGRRDHQVKIRGHRIELGEIETTLTTHPHIADAVVVTTGENRQRLAAFVIPAVDGLDLDSLGGFLADRLPSHSVPSSIQALPSWPLTGNGKIDRAELSRRAEQDGGGAAGAEEPLHGDAEVLIAKVCAELLELPTVGRKQNFFALGGDSVLATRLIAQIRDLLGPELSMRQVFADPTVAGLAARVTEAWAHADDFEEGVL